MAKAATRKTPAEKPRAAKDRQFVTALARGLDILRAFTPRHPVLGNNEIAQRAHLPKPTVTRLTYTLTQLGYLNYSPESGKYSLSVGVLALGYSFLASQDIRAIARPLMQERRGALVTLTYLGAVRALANYNVMGLAKASLEANVRYMAAALGPEHIRVNGISAGPIKTLAAAGIGGFSKILNFVEKNAPLRRNVTIDEVGNVAAFLLSDLASGITGEITYVDCGFSTVAAGIDE